MTDLKAAFRRCLEECDVDGMLRLHAHVNPHLPPPSSREQALASIHYARTQMASLPTRLRYYSHRWLIDQGHPSALPDPLKPLAERMYPRTVAAVGISLAARSELFRPIMGEVRAAMEYAVLEADGDRKLEDTPHVRARMAEAKAKTIRKLVGTVG